MDFAEAQRRYWELKERYEAGFLKPAQFQAQVEELTVQDDQGRWWMIGVESGKWYVSLAGQWVEAQPPITPAEETAPHAAPPAEPPAEETALAEETTAGGTIPSIEPPMVAEQARQTVLAQPVPIQPSYAPPVPVEAEEPKRRWPLFLALGGLGIVAVVVAVAALLYFARRQSEATPTPSPTSAVAQATEAETPTPQVIVVTATPEPVTPTPPPSPTSEEAPTESPTSTPTEAGETPALSLLSPEVTTDVEADVYSGPGTDYDLLGSLPVGETVAVSGRNNKGSWWRIVYPPGPGAHGWVSADDVIPNEDAASVAVITAPATPTQAPSAAPTEAPSKPTSAPAQPTPKPAPSGGLSGKLAFSLLQNIEYKVYVVQLPGKEYIASIGNAQQPNLRSDGNRLAVNGFGGGGMETIWTLSPEGKEGKEVTCYNNNAHPFLSPDGVYVVFDDAVLDPRGGRIYVQKVNERNCDLHKYPLTAGGTPLKDIVGGAGSYMFPLWSADNRIVFRGCDTWAGTGGTNCGLWAINPDGSKPTRITTNPDIIPTDTKGDVVAFMSAASGNWEVYTVSLGGGEPRKLTENQAMDGLPTISPDMQHIAFISDRAGEGLWSIWVMGMDGSDQQKLMDFNPDMGAVDRDTWTLERMSWGP
jgi:uncharacterized protein YraI